METQTIKKYVKCKPPNPYFKLKTEENMFPYSSQRNYYVTFLQKK